MASTDRDSIREEHMLTYVSELRSFALAAQLPWDAPDALLHVQERLRCDKSFRSDLEATLRSFLYREEFRLTGADLLRMLVLAFPGGGGGAEASAKQQRALQMLVAQAMTIPKFSDDDESRPGEGDETSRELSVSHGEALPEHAFPEAAARHEAATAVPWWAEPNSAAAAGPRPEVLGGAKAVRGNPWQDGSVLHRELLAFAENRQLRRM